MQFFILFKNVVIFKRDRRHKPRVHEYHCLIYFDYILSDLCTQLEMDFFLFEYNSIFEEKRFLTNWVINKGSVEQLG